MLANYKTCLAAVLKYEGGYSNNPADPGGATMKGITQKVYDVWRRKQGLGIQSVRSISQPEVESIYKNNYWDVVRGDDLPSGLDLAVFDYAVNSGPGRAIRQLQKVLGVQQTGVMNAATIAAAKKNPESWAALCNERLAFMKRLDTWPVFGKGWESRVNDVRKKAGSLSSLWPVPEVEPKAEPKPDIDITAAQKRLSFLSYPLGSIDGKIGPLTRSAIRDFQDANGEPVTGNLDKRTFDLLMSDSALKRPVSPEREALTAVDLKNQGSTIVTAADSIKKNITTAGAALAGASGVASQVSDAKDQLQNIQDAISTGHTGLDWAKNNWQMILIVILLVVVLFCIVKCWELATSVENERVRQAKTGENVRY